MPLPIPLAVVTFDQVQAAQRGDLIAMSDLRPLTCCTSLKAPSNPDCIAPARHFERGGRHSTPRQSACVANLRHVAVDKAVFDVPFEFFLAIY